MNHSPLLGLDDEPEPHRPGHGVTALGPSDTSDSGSDMSGIDVDGSQMGLDLDTDAEGTGERLGAPGDPRVQEAGDILPDRVDVVPELPVLGEDATTDDLPAQDSPGGSPDDAPEHATMDETREDAARARDAQRRDARQSLIGQSDDADV